MSSRSKVYRLLFQALLEMRDRGNTSGDKVVFHLADLFHNAVLQLEQAESDASFEQVLKFLEQRAKEKGCEEWLERHLQELEANSAK